MQQKIKYPSWVTPGKFIRGDIKWDDGKKFYWTGAAWIPEARANIQLKQLSSKRGKHVKDQELYRKSGF